MDPSIEVKLDMTDIGEDCPHREQLEHTLLHCQTQSEILQATRDNYLSIIEEFQRDLEELTEQVEQQQQQQQQQQIELASKESEQSYEEPPRISTNELELQNEHLTHRIHGLQEKLQDREAQIAHLRSIIGSYADETDRLVESRTLKNEIQELKRKNTEQSQKISEYAGLLKKQQEERLKLCRNYESLTNCSEEQSKELRRASREARSLQDRVSQGEKKQEELKAERNLLREEVVALKEKDAMSTGRERALCEQLKSSQQELDKSRCLIRDMQAHLKQEERLHKDTVDRLCRSNEQTRLEMRAVACEYKQMQLKLKQQTSVTEQQQGIIESFRQWKTAQVRSDEAMRRCLKRSEHHVSMLLEENHNQCDDYKRLYGDYSILDAEMRRMKSAVDGRLPASSSAQPGSVILRGQEVQDEMAHRLRLMCNTSQRLADQHKYLYGGSLDPLSQRHAGGDREQPSTSTRSPKPRPST